MPTSKAPRNKFKYYTTDIEDDDEDVYSDEDEASDGYHPLLSVFKRTECPDEFEDEGYSRSNRYMKVLLVFFAFLLCLVVLVVCTLLVPASTRTVVGSDRIEVDDVWVVGLPKLMTQSALRMVDINKDEVLDVVLGFGTGVGESEVSRIFCDMFFDGNHPCGGGVLALNGKTGAELWRHYTDHEVYALNCNNDLNDDGYIDCLAAGRAGVFIAICGQKGHLLWDYGSKSTKTVYNPVDLPDLDQDGFPEILISHGDDPLQEKDTPLSIPSLLVIVSGRTGQALRSLEVPNQKSTYYPPQLHTEGDGTTVVLFGTGGETHPRALWKIPLDDLYTGNIDKAVTIYKDNGVVAPAILVDMNRDRVEDIVISLFNFTTIVFDGNTYVQMWNYTIPQTKTHSSPAVGYFNDDDIPDVLVKYSRYPGTSIINISREAAVNVLSGKTGMSLLEKNPRDGFEFSASPLTIGMRGRGNDVFLYWTADCLGHDVKEGSYELEKRTNETNRADLPKLLCNATLSTKLLALGSSFSLPGATVYNSGERYNDEHSAMPNATQEQEHRNPQDRPSYARKKTRQKKELREEALDRKRRHVGITDRDGIQTSVSTGSLAPTLLPASDTDYRRSIDLIFATSWTPAGLPVAILPTIKACIASGMSKEIIRFDNTSKFYELDHENYKQYITEKCLKKMNKTITKTKPVDDPNNSNMGQLTVYRLRIKFKCSKEVMLRSDHATCAEVLPYDEQPWPAYMGRYGDSKWGVKK